MIAHGLAVAPGLAICARCDLPVQLELTRNDGLGKITFADEIRDHADFPDRFGIEQEPRVAQTWFFLPKRALDVGKNLSSPDFSCVRERRRTGVGIDRRTMANDQQTGVRFAFHAS